MRTNEQILERHQSEESEDFFNIQRSILLCLLPFELAKPYLQEEYVKGHEDGSLPEDERWNEDIDVKAQMMTFMPDLQNFIYKGDTSGIVQGFLALRVWLWVIDEDFYDEVKDELINTVEESPEDLFRKISRHIGFSPAIEDIAFEEIPNEVPCKEQD